MLDAYRFKEFNGNKGVATRQRETFVNALKRIFDWRDDVAFPPEILPIRPSHTELRIIHQRGVFTFHGPTHPILSDKDNRTLRAYPIPKKEIERGLRLLGVNEFSIYGDLPNLAARLKIAHEVD